MSETITASKPAIKIDRGSMAISMQLDACHTPGPDEFIGKKPGPPRKAENG